MLLVTRLWADTPQMLHTIIDYDVHQALYWIMSMD